MELERGWPTREHIHERQQSFRSQPSLRLDRATNPLCWYSQASGGSGASTHATAALTAPISKTQVLHLFGFHSLVATTPDAATTEVCDYQNTPGAAAIEAATETFTTFLGTILSRTATTSGNSICSSRSAR